MDNRTITLRELYIGLAAQSVLARSSTHSKLSAASTLVERAAEIAEIADAMIQASGPIRKEEPITFDVD